MFHLLNYWVFKHYKRMQVRQTTKTHISLCFITFNHCFVCIYLIHKVGFLYIIRLCIRLHKILFTICIFKCKDVKSEQTCALNDLNLQIFTNVQSTIHNSKLHYFKFEFIKSNYTNTPSECHKRHFWRGCEIYAQGDGRKILRDSQSMKKVRKCLFHKP